MENPALPGLQPSAAVAEKRGRGRPKGSTNKRSADLVRYIEAQYAGLTPGQVSAALGLVTPKELRAAKAARAEHAGLGDLQIAMVLKARALGRAIGADTAEAWALMARERAELMPYVHQKLPTKVELDGKGALIPMVMMVGDPGGAGGPLLEGDWNEAEENQRLSQFAPVQVSSPKSHD